MVTQTPELDEIKHLMDAENDFCTAAELAGILVEFTKDNDEKFAALHLLGICTRMVFGGDSLSERMLQTVIELELRHTDKTLAPRAHRDLGMVYVDMEDYSKAGHHVETSYFLLEEQGEYQEAAISQGFIGRVALCVGDTERAYLLMSLADEKLKHGDDRSAELNNLIWLMQASVPLQRLKDHRRAIKLAKQVGTKRRCKEAHLILLSPRLYKFAKARLPRN